MTDKQIRVRFAPSPTGYLHIGNARTALFNWLFARKYRGRFVLRVEDTDQERANREFEKSIIDDLHWLGLTWDEGPLREGPYGPYRQSERQQFYREAAEKLLREGKAYYCYCTPEELARQRKEMLASGRPPMYQGNCYRISDKKKRRLEKEGRKPSVRFHIEGAGKETVHDLVHGQIDVGLAVVGDFIILRSNGVAAYNLAVVVDDALMEISHVMRGEDHLPNTPRQQLLYKALRYSPPVFIHLPMILGPDRAMLSKRHGATSLNQFRREGYLQEALLNCLALLGWSAGDERELFNLEELVEAFSLSRLAKGAALFDTGKLAWLNAHYIREKNPAELLELCLPYLLKTGCLKGRPDGEELLRAQRVCEATRPNLATLADITRYARPFFADEIEWEPQALEAVKNGRAVLDALRAALQPPSPLNEETFRQTTKNIQVATGLKGKKLYLPIRAALSGSLRGPELKHLILLLPRERCLRRIERALKIIDQKTT